MAITNNSFEKLKVWQIAHKFVLDIYKVSKSFPKEERFRLVDQLCRAASSVPANIVEGNSRGHSKEYLQFLNTAQSSLDEAKYHLILAKDLGYINEKTCSTLLEDALVISKMLSSLKRYLKSRI